MHEGEIIRYLRKQKKMTQEELAYSICSIRHLRDIEKNETTASYEHITSLCEKLGGDIHLMVSKDVQRYGLDLYKYMLELKRLFENWEYVLLQEKVNILLQDKTYSLTGNIYLELKYYEAVCLKEVNNDLKGTKTKLMRIIDCTSHSETVNYLKSIRNEIELNICNGIGVSYFYEEYYQEALDIYETIKDNLDRYNQGDLSFQAKINYNCIKIAYKMGRFDEAIEMAKENIRFCKKEKIVENLRNSYLYLAKSMEDNGNPQNKYLKFYEKYIWLGIMFEENGKVDKIMEEIIQKYPIRFDLNKLKEEV